MTRVEVRSDDFSEYLQNPTDEDSPYAEDIYDHMAGFYFQKLGAQNPRFKRGSTRSGLRVVTRLAKFAVALYPEHAAELGIPVRAEELRDILLESVDTPLKFAHLSQRTNNHVEHAFGLARGGIPADVSECYRFEPNTSRGTLFVADDDRFYQAVSEGRSQDPDYNVASKCPMTQITKRIIWPGVVCLAAEAPEAFARDLSL